MKKNEKILRGLVTNYGFKEGMPKGLYTIWVEWPDPRETHKGSLLYADFFCAGKPKITRDFLKQIVLMKNKFLK